VAAGAARASAPPIGYVPGRETRTMQQRPIRLTDPGRLDRELHELEGIVQGIAIDGRINAEEARVLAEWCGRHEDAALRSPFDELVPKLRESIADSVLDVEERRDILWLIERCGTPNAFYNVAASDLQRLHGVLLGIGADGAVDAPEVAALRSWLDGARMLRGNWPYDEIDGLLAHVLRDGRIEPREQGLLAAFCRDFVGAVPHLILQSSFDEELVRFGVCTAAPRVEFKGRQFAVTGSSPKRSRAQVHELVVRLGGGVQDDVTEQLDYLVVCDAGDRSWAFSCHGRKVETAMQLRRDGARIAIVHESDFLAAARALGEEA
jgi:hypothetical protein